MTGRKLAVVVLLAGSSLWGCGGSDRGRPRPNPKLPELSTSVPHDDRAPGPQIFAPASIWNAPLAADAPLDPSSPRLIQGLNAEVRREQQARTGPYIETTFGSVPVYTVGRRQATSPVRLRTQAPYVRTLQRAFDRVPIPAGARPAPGTDGHMTIYQPSTDKLWEFWRAQKQGKQWVASYGGAIDSVSRSPGYFTPSAWPGSRFVWGATASSLPLAGGLLRIRELERGDIQHALAVALPFPRKDVFSLPAQRTDGTDPSPDAIPEGARLRLDPSFDVDQLDADPIVKTLARAAQRYGILVRDRTGVAVGFYAEDPHQYGENPYPRLFENQSPTVLMAQFPWSRLQVVKMHLRHNP